MRLPNEKVEPTIEDYAHSRLLSYVKLNYPSYIIGKVHKLTAHYLQKLENGDINRLAIFMPPRTGKTILASEFFASWYLGRNPDHEVIFTSYSQDRADDVGKNVRNIMASDVHGSVFPNGQLRTDSKGSRKLMTEQGGVYVAVGWGGAITGRGANCLILDDLIKDAKDAQSESNRRSREEWFSSTAYTRLMSDSKSTEDGRILLIMTRWTYTDIASYLLNELGHEQWHILNFPAIAEEEDALGRKPGEPLWPEKFPIKRLNKIKQSVSAEHWNALYQQQPLPKEGGMVKIDDFNRYNPHRMWRIEELCRENQKLPEELKWFHKIIISIDTAYKPKEINDPSAITVWGYGGNQHFLLEAITERLEFPDLKRKVIQIRNKYLKWNLGPVPVLIEDAASGQSLIQELQRTTKIAIISIKATNSKIVRLSEVTEHIEAGQVYLPEKARWLADYETQLARFPYAAHDDYVDSTSQYLRWAFRKKKLRFTRKHKKVYAK